MKIFRHLAILLSASLTTFAAPVLANEPKDWQLGLQPPVSPSAVRINEFHDMLLWIIFGIAIFVLLLLVWVIIRYNSKVNPEPAKFTHNVLIEVIWTVVPVIILIIIAIPSFKVLYYNDSVENPEMTLKITGYAWYWGYEYPDHDGISFLANMVPDEDIGPDQRRLLSTDNVVVLPIDTNIALQITAGDVLHSWTVPAFGVKMDAVPGRLNETWVRIEKPGTYYGQCSELCGLKHAYMPIEIRAVTKEEFEEWLVTAKEEFASLESDDALIRLAGFQN
ncbi:MAG: cytochrome c oxidase subunit II [Pseudomonadota bacterium]